MEALKVKDIPIELAFKQVARAVNKETGGQQTPWISSSLLDDFYCNPSHEASLATPTPAKPTPTPVSSPVSDYKARTERLLGWFTAHSDTATRGELDRMYKDPEAVKWFRQASDQGDAIAQLMLGRMFASGLEASTDEAEAVKWYRKAADQGNAQAQSNLGTMYRNGKGVPKDYEEALKWYRKAADQGNANAQEIWGGCTRMGLEFPRITREAVKWYRKAADQGNAKGQKQFGECVQEWLGVPEGL